MTVFDVHSNFGYATITTAPDPAGSGTTLVVSTATFADFPDPGTIGYNVVVWPAGTIPLSSNAEIVRVVTKGTNGTLEVTREQESTTARDITVGDQCGVAITKKIVTDIENTVGSATWINNLTELTTPASGDLLPIVDDPGGSPVTKKITLANVIKLIYPVGSIFISTSSTNPGTYLGGTWVAFGAGKTLVGLDSGDGDFDTAEETGGVKEVTLTAAQSGLPAHTHGVYYTSNNGADGTIRETIAGSGTTTNTTQNATQNAASAHTNLQPYIVIYMFKRTA